jgi:hypothetical protein
MVIARKLELNRKLFSNQISSILDSALVGAGSLRPFKSNFAGALYTKF